MTIWNTSAAKRVLRRVAQPTTTSFWETEKCITDKNDSDMKGTEHFKRTIQMYLEQRAAEDTLFAKNYRNPAKNIDDCVTYILNSGIEEKVSFSAKILFFSGEQKAYFYSNPLQNHGFHLPHDIRYVRLPRHDGPHK